MDPKEKEEHRRLVAESARKQLADGTWPQVMMVFGYRTPRAKRWTKEEIAALRGLFEKGGLVNMVAFIDLVQFEEERLGVPMSFNLSTRSRSSPGDATPTTENVRAFFGSKDILVGTRGGVDSALTWLKNFSEATQTAAPESLQVFDKIFGEAVGFLQSQGKSVTVGEMLKEALSPSLEGLGDEKPPSTN